MLSYTLHALKIAIFARESVDLHGPLSQAQTQEETDEGTEMRNHLPKKYEKFIAGLPFFILDWEAPWASLQQVARHRYQCSDGCYISSFGVCS